MKNPDNPKTSANRRSRQHGFTLVEVLMAIVILLVGIVAVAQLVPASIGSNTVNRNDSSALVFAQRQMDQFLSQPLINTTYSETIDGQPFLCNLGDPTQPSNTVVGSPHVVINNQLIINFAAPKKAGYSFPSPGYQDPNDPAGVFYDVRWAVITVTNNGLVTSKRFILGVRKIGGNGIYNPVTLDTILSK